MNDFPWGVAIGLGIILLGTLGCIVYIMMLDYLESKK
jgi:preprotein translocase subunit Sss1